MSQLWTKLWEVSPRVASRASDLLHGVVWQAYSDKEITLSLLMLLATKARRIILVQTDHDLERFVNFNVFQLCGVHDTNHHVQELDLQGIYLGPGTRLLLHLLPRCTQLKILKLGVNSCDQVLYASQACPLQVLYISEWNMRRCKVTQEFLMELITGIRNKSVAEFFSDIRCGNPIIINPTWPNLVEVCFGNCNVQCEFIVMMLMMFPALQWKSTNLFENQRVINEYYFQMLQMGSLHKLALRTSNVIVNTNFMNVLPYAAPLLEEIKVSVRYKSGFMYIHEMLKLCTVFLSLRSLHLYELLHFTPGEPPFQIFSALGSRLLSLDLHGGKVCAIRLKDLRMCLELCPVLQDVTFGFIHGIGCDSTDLQENKQFENLKSLKCASKYLNHYALCCLLNMLPKLEKFIVAGSVDNVDLLLTHLPSLLELRVLKWMMRNKLSVESLCRMPRASTDARPWQLYAPVRCIGHGDKKKLIKCGWSYIPLSSHEPE